jgi:HD-GYP domain-containing protein (c-di-GMP phosphodiesterase class II)
MLTGEREAWGQAPLPGGPNLAVATLELTLGLLESQTPYFIGHAARVADLAAGIGTKLGLSDAELDDLRVAGRLHDLGMVAVPSGILTATAALTPAEAALVRLHPTIGAQIVASIVSPAIQAAIRGHHERWDGTGYPDGLAGPAIPLAARIIGAAEVFDAMVSHRPYRPGLPESAALERVQHLAGTVLDPVVIEAMVAALRNPQRLAFLPDDYPSGVEMDPGLWHRAAHPSPDAARTILPAAPVAEPERP